MTNKISRNSELREALADAYHAAKDAGARTVDDLVERMAEYVVMRCPALAAAPAPETLRDQLRNSASGLHNFARMAKVATHTTDDWHDCPAEPCVEARAALAAAILAAPVSRMG